MKTYSISAIILASLLGGMLITLPNIRVDAVPKMTFRSESSKATHIDERLAPKSVLTDTYHGNGFYTYTKTLSVPSGCSCTWYVADVPNQINIKDSGGNSVYSLGWRGTANYQGPWGSSLSTSNTFYFNLSPGTYTVYVDTVTNTGNGGSDDAWYIYY